MRFDELHLRPRGEPEPFQIVEATVDDIHNAMKAGELTSHELVQQYLDRIAMRRTSAGRTSPRLSP